MLSQSHHRFFHRENRDGTFDSICGECFATVASDQFKANLTKAEKNHVCAAWRIETLKRYKSSPAKN